MADLGLAVLQDGVDKLLDGQRQIMALIKEGQRTALRHEELQPQALKLARLLEIERRITELEALLQLQQTITELERRVATLEGRQHAALEHKL